MNNPLITVYITNYNYGRFIEKAIDSVLQQTEKNFELIIIDDGSTDDSHQIISHLEQKIKNHIALERLTIIFQKNLGLNKTNNLALQKAKGRYLIRLDADDYFDPRALEIMSLALEKNHNLALVFPDYYLMDEKANILNLYQRNNFKNEVSLLDRPAHGACTMIRIEYLKERGGYNESFSCQDGYDLWLKMTTHYSVENIGLPLFYYRQHGKNLSGDSERILTTRGKILSLHSEDHHLKKIKTAAIIPIRGPALDSNSIALKKIGGKEILRWTLDHALNTDQLSEIIISGPDQNISNFIKEHYSQKIGTKIILHHREENLCLPQVGISQTLKKVHQDLAYLKNEAYCLLYIESPFRSSEYINKAINTMKLYDVDSIDGVWQDNSFLYQHDGHGLHPLNQRPFFQRERDDVFKRTGGIQLIKTRLIEENKEWQEGVIGHILLDQQAAFSIKGQFDLELADFIANKIVNNSITTSDNKNSLSVLQ